MRALGPCGLIATLVLGAGCRSDRRTQPVACATSLAVPAPTRGPVSGPIRVGPNGRYFVSRDGEPFFWLGDTAWPLLVEYPPAAARAYLRNRAEKGFTVVQTVIAWPHWGTGFEKSSTPTANVIGETPWLGNDPATPNDAYFRHVDELVQEADQQGLVLAMQPSWGYYVNEARILTAKNARAYGRWLGTRYRSAPNVVWMMGGDRPAAGFEDVWRELAGGLRDGDGGVHLISYHPCYGRSSAQYFHDATLSFNMIQTWADWPSVHPAVLADVLRTPAKPAVHAEGAYENGPEYPTGPITPLLVRRQAWWAFMAGGFHTYGQNEMWRIEKGWEQTFDTPGAIQVARVKQILSSRNWWELVPDQSLFASGVGSEKTLNAAMRSISGDYAIVYFAGRGHAVLHLDKVAARRVKATWVNPATGECRDGGIYETGNLDGKVACDLRTQSFSTPGSWEDAVLLLEGTSG